jgi:Uma2 family endonuclease
VQGTVVVAEGHVFDPDLMLLRRRSEGYKHALPRATDVVLVIESSASSLPRDRHVKLPTYATAGVQEYGIAELQREALIVFRVPHGSEYRSETLWRGDETVAPVACPDLLIRAADIFA